MNENAVVKALFEYLVYHGWLVIRINSGAAQPERESGERGFIPFNRWQVLGNDIQTSGVSDLLAIHPDYPPLVIEAKAVGKLANVSEAQSHFLMEWVNHGGLGCVASEIDHLIAALEGVKT